MEFEIVWSKFAESEIDDIYTYYSEKATEQIALNIIIGIVHSADILKTSHFIGQIEKLLKDRDLEYRYLVHNNYKLIYTVDMKEKLIKISDVFDTRQNPIKIKISK